MATKAKPIPDGYHTATPYLIINGAARALDFYKKALGAKELMRMEAPGGKVGHAEIQIGDSRIMLADEFPQMGARSAETIGGCPMFLMLYVPDVDATFNQAIAAGGKVEQPIENKFYGDRSGVFVDPFKYRWCIATHVEDVPPDEMRRRAAAAMAQEK